MRAFKICLPAVLAIGMGIPAISAEPVQIGWADLAPPAPVYENPFEEIRSDQIDDLRIILLSREGQSAGEASIDTEEAAAARARLVAEGLDVEGLFAQRELIMEARRMEATNTVPSLVGRNVSLPGYVLPLDLKDGKVVEFLLVPTVGACIHTPPPPANQMIHVRYPEGFEVAGLYTPVWIHGELDSNLTTQKVSYVDGATHVEVSYTMTADRLEEY